MNLIFLKFLQGKFSHVCTPLNMEGNVEIVYKVGEHSFKYHDLSIRVDKVHQRLQVFAKNNGKALEVKVNIKR